MADTLQADICVIGGGSAGLSVAAGAAQMGAETVLIERAIVCQIESLTRCSRSSIVLTLWCFKFSRIRSKITIVSWIQ